MGAHRCRLHALPSTLLLRNAGHWARTQPLRSTCTHPRQRDRLHVSPRLPCAARIIQPPPLDQAQLTAVKARLGGQHALHLQPLRLDIGLHRRGAARVAHKARQLGFAHAQNHALGDPAAAPVRRVCKLDIVLASPLGLAAPQDGVHLCSKVRPSTRGQGRQRATRSRVCVKRRPLSLGIPRAILCKKTPSPGPALLGRGRR